MDDAERKVTTMVECPDNTRAKVLMLGPALSDQGGMVTAEQILLAEWDDSRYDLKHIATFNTTVPQFMKLLIALGALSQFLYWAVLWRPDILHIHFTGGRSFYRKSIFVILAKIMRIRIILHCHSSRFDPNKKRSKLDEKYSRLIVNCADRLLVLGEEWRERFESLALSVPILVLHNAVVCPQDVPTSTNDKAVVLSLGRLGKRKGTYDILQAIPHVVDIHPEAEFWFGGDGDVEQVRSILSTESWGKHVRLLGWVRGKEKEKVLSQASVFLLPSYHEGLPFAILEAMAYGLPIIGTPVGGIPEAVTDGETGFLIQPGDTEAVVQRITLLLDNPELRERMGASARQRIREEFEAGAMIQRLFAIYDSLMLER